MNIFLTGATGFVGSFLAEALLKKGHNVRVLVRTTSNLRWIADLDVDCFYGNLDDAETLKHGLKGMDYVYHVAGLTKALNPYDFFRVNYEGTRNFIDAIIEAGIPLERFVLISSQAAIGPSPTIEPIDETATAHPLTDYGMSKLKAEQYVLSQKKKLPVTVVRPPAVYGPRDTDVLNFFKTVKLGIIPRLGGKERYLSLIYVKDLVEGIIRAAERKKSLSKVYFLANPQPYSLETLARSTLKYFGKRGVTLNVPMFLMRSAATFSEGFSKLLARPSIVNRQKIAEMKANFWVCSPARAKRDLGFEAPTSLEQGINETLSWYEAAGWL